MRRGRSQAAPPPRFARLLAVLLRVLPCCVAGFLAVWSGADAVLQGGRALPRCCEGASCRRMKPRPPLRAPSPHHVKPTPPLHASSYRRVKPRPPLHAHNTTIQANFGTQGRLRLHLLEPQGTQGRCRFHPFPRVPSYGGACPRTSRGHDATRPAAAPRYSAAVPKSRRSLARGSTVVSCPPEHYVPSAPIAMAQIAARGGASNVGSADNRETACTSRGA